MPSFSPQSKRYQPISQHADTWLLMFSATLTYDTLRFGEFEDFPETSEPVWILGKQFNALTGRGSHQTNCHNVPPRA